MKMIKKVNIQNIGSFLDFDWDKSFPSFTDENWRTKQTQLEKINIFYWDNWNWKSTFVNILKALNWDNVNLEKNWNIWDSKEKNVKVVDETKNEYFLWDDRLQDKFLFFDKEYISLNVWDIVFDYDNKEVKKHRWERLLNLWWFVEKEKVMDKYEKIIADLKSRNDKFWEEIKKKEEILNGKLSGWKKIEDFDIEEIKNEEKSLLDEKIKKIEIELGKVKKSMNEGENIKKLWYLDKLWIISNFDRSEYEKLFVKKFWIMDFLYWEKDIIEDMLSITNKNNLDKCLFCWQDIKKEWKYIKRIEKLNQFFSDNEKEISEKLLYLQNIIDNYFSGNTFDDIIKDNTIKLKEAGKYISWLPDKLDFSFSLLSEENEYLNDLKEKIRRKNNVKSESIEINLKTIEKLINRFNSKVVSYNEKVENINRKIEKLKKETNDNLKIRHEELNNSLTELKNIKVLKENFNNFMKILELNEVLKSNDDKIEEIKKSKERYRKKLIEDFNEFASKYWSNIKKVFNKLNSSLNVDFTILSDTTYSYNSAKYWFKLEYKNKDISFHLSEWEKRSIALSYFFAEILQNIEDKNTLEEHIKELKKQIKIETEWEKKKEIGKKIVKNQNKLEEIKKFFDRILVIDDPAVDFDAWHKKEIATYIAKISKEFNQVLVFSHDELFIKYLSHSIKEAKKELWIYKTMWVSNITEFNTNIFKSYLNDLRKFINRTPDKKIEFEELYVIVYKLRFCLEAFVKIELLWFDKNKLDNILEANVWKIDKIKKVSVKVDELRDIYNYCNNNWSHFGINEWSNSVENKVKKFIEIYDSL